MLSNNGMTKKKRSFFLVILILYIKFINHHRELQYVVNNASKQDKS